MAASYERGTPVLLPSGIQGLAEPGDRSEMQHDNQPLLDQQWYEGLEPE